MGFWSALREVFCPRHPFAAPEERHRLFEGVILWRRKAAGDDLRRPTPSLAEKRSALIASIAKERHHPRNIEYRDLVPEHIRNHYREVWRTEDAKLLAEDPTRALR